MSAVLTENKLSMIFFFKLKDLRTLLLNFNLRQVVFQNSCIVFCFDQFKSAEPYILKLSQLTKCFKVYSIVYKSTCIHASKSYMYIFIRQTVRKNIKANI